MAHAFLSPSAAHRWMLCPAAPTAEHIFPEEDSSYAAEGTLAHAWAAHILQPDKHPAPEEKLSDEQMAFVQQYVDFVLANTDDFREIELPLDLATVAGLEGKGTADCAAMDGTTLKIIDLKFGQGVVVNAEKNPQLMIYAAAAVDYFDLLAEVEKVELTIFQPRTVPANVSQWIITRDELDRWVNDELKPAVDTAVEARRQFETNNGRVDGSLFQPGAVQCRFCRARGNCPMQALAALSAATGKPASKDVLVNIAFGEPKYIADYYGKLEMVEQWVKAVKDRAMSMLMAGKELPGYKLIAGRKGARAWSDADAAEQMLKTFKVKLEDRYTFKVISPTQAEKLFKAGTIGERQWPKLQGLITQSEGAPTIVPETDPRPAVTPGQPAFKDLDATK